MVAPTIHVSPTVQEKERLRKFVAEWPELEQGFDEDLPEAGEFLSLLHVKTIGPCEGEGTCFRLPNPAEDRKSFYQELEKVGRICQSKIVPRTSS